ncbi:MAG: rhamnulokinase [Deltaproteobacteria bacterium]|nr:rhamnulokinase [Deltaproteobacteria bacterium]
MERYFLAIDIGASNGRHALGWIKDGRLNFEIIHRFDNQVINENGRLVWDLRALWREIKTGLRRCAEMGKIPESLGLDTWGVDYVLLDQDDQIIGRPYAYRDGRTEGQVERLEETIGWEELYERTGIQKMPINTIYQLGACQREEPGLLAKAKSFLMIPDFFNFLLCGRKKAEYTNASTTSLVSLRTGDWDWELITLMGLDPYIFPPISQPGLVLGAMLGGLAREVGFSCQVVAGATHDTASAVAASPALSGEVAFLSSGTWSLMGSELEIPIVTSKSRDLNFTNEGGYAGRIRFLKNIMGLWMIQSLRREMGEELSFGQLMDLAQASDFGFEPIIDCNDPRFIAPKSMKAEIVAACLEKGQRRPERAGHLAAVVYHSLAACYAKTLDELKAATGKEFTAINVFGGGSQASFLNQLTARATNLKVMAGPVEATAIGNLLTQMMAVGLLANLNEARDLVARSFDIEIFPAGSGRPALAPGPEMVGLGK